jgi:hypothetical protein
LRGCFLFTNLEEFLLSGTIALLRRTTFVKFFPLLHRASATAATEGERGGEREAARCGVEREAERGGVEREAARCGVEREAERRGGEREAERRGGEREAERRGGERLPLVDRFFGGMLFLHDNQDFNRQVSSLFFFFHRKTQCYVTTP